MTRGEAAAANADHAIRVMYSKFPHPAISRLMKAAPEKRAMQ